MPKDKNMKDTGETVKVMALADILTFKQQQGDGEIDGVKFNLTSLIPGGAPMVTFDVKMNGRELSPAYTIDLRDFVTKAYEALKRDREKAKA